VPYSRAEFYVYGEVFRGSIEFCNLNTIAVTSEEYDEKNSSCGIFNKLGIRKKKTKDLLSSLSFLCNSGSTKNLPGIGESNKQFTFQIRE